MIVDTMHSEELASEIFQDVQSVHKKTKYLMQSCRRKAIKSKNKHHRQFFDYKSQQKNDWLILVDFYVKDPLSLCVVLYKDQYGFNAIMPDPEDGKTLNHYSGHFLDRFNERLIKKNDLTKKDLIKRYISENAVYDFEVLPDNERYSNPFFGRSREGIMLGNTEYLKNYRIQYFRTFISEEMTFKSQEGTLNLANEYYEKFWEENMGKIGRKAFD